MTRYLCATCGTQFPESGEPPAHCPICEDERQYVPPTGQAWTDIETLARDHRIDWQAEEEGLFSLRITPSFGIGQRAFLVQQDDGNILWDCLSLIDAETVSRINGLGGLAAIAISHPHYYSSMLEWSDAFGGVPIHIHEADRDWVQRPGDAVKLWQGETLQSGEATMIRCGGHFSGASVLHCPWLAGGKGALFSGDTIQVALDRKHVSFMYSYPNYIPLGAKEVNAIVEAVTPFSFEAIHGAFDGRSLLASGREAVVRSAHRYLNAIGSDVQSGD